MLKIAIYQGQTPDLPPASLNVVIDVIRAFTTTQIAFQKGVSEILLADTVEEAWELKRRFGPALLAGEVNALPIPGFDFGNSPAEMDAAPGLSGAKMILRTTNGVRAALHSLGSGPVAVAGFINSRACAEYILKGQKEGRIRSVNLVASHPTGDEDMACAEYLRDLVLGEGRITPEEVAVRIRSCKNAEKFLDGLTPQLSPKDIEFCSRESSQGCVMLAGGGSPNPISIKVLK